MAVAAVVSTKGALGKTELPPPLRGHVMPIHLSSIGVRAKMNIRFL